MTLTLFEYYALNYSRCSLDFGFLATWQGLAYPIHIIQAVSFPFQMLTFYVILKHTPVHMKSVKMSILMNHLWCTLLDFIICMLSTPYIFLPYLGFFGVGFFSWLGIPYLYQMVLAILVAFLASGSYIYLFESRSCSIQENRFRFRRTRNRVLYHLSIFILDLPLFCLFLNVPLNQEEAKLKVLILDPCPTPEFFSADVLIIVTDANTIHFYTWIFIPLLLFHSVFHVLFHATCTLYYIFIAPSKSTSPHTRQIQRQFFFGLIFQTGIPVVLLVAPMLYSICAFLVDQLDQEWMNLAVIIAGLHGIGESLVVILVHSSYRNAVCRMLPKLGKRSEVGSRRLSKPLSRF